MHSLKILTEFCSTLVQTAYDDPHKDPPRAEAADDEMKEVVRTAIFHIRCRVDLEGRGSSTSSASNTAHMTQNTVPPSEANLPVGAALPPHWRSAAGRMAVEVALGLPEVAVALAVELVVDLAMNLAVEVAGRWGC